MNFVSTWLRLELPRRWHSLAVLTLLIAVASGTVMTAAAGARRGASALERLYERTKPATSAVFTNTANYNWDKIRSLPEVEALTTFVIDYAYSFEGYPEGVGGFPLADAETLTNIETPVVYSGRMFDPARDDEVVVTRDFVANFHKHVGDTVVLNLPTPQELAEQSSGPGGAFTGAHLRMRIVGVINSPWFSDEPGAKGFIQRLLGVTGAYLASQYFPLGTAKIGEAAPGISADWIVFAPGLALVPLLAGGGAAAAAWLNLAAARRGNAPRKSTVASVAIRWGLPVPVVVGTRFALEPGRGRIAVPVRPALIGAVIGVLGILAAFTFSHGVSDVVTHPERLGQTHQLEAFIGANGQDFLPATQLLAIATANPDVIGVDDARQAVATGPGGSISVYSYTAGPKAIAAVVVSGRMPTSADEIALGPRMLVFQGVRVGQMVRLSGDNGTHLYKVTGSGLVPEGPRNGYAEGAWISPAGYDLIFEKHKFHSLLVSLRPGADVAATIAALAKATDTAIPEAQGFAFSPPDPPVEVAEIRSVRTLPIALGGFLALLAVGAVGHALATAVRRRSHDVAVLRALGMTQWQCRWIVVTQASVLALIGLLFGVPLGLATGRTLWRVVADYTPLQYVAPTAPWALLVIAPAALLVANLLAAVPGRRAARLKISHVLRTE